jgi:hypothetical protein
LYYIPIGEYVKPRLSGADWRCALPAALSTVDVHFGSVDGPIRTYVCYLKSGLPGHFAFFGRSATAAERFQNLVIGSGVAGKILAWTMAKQGQKTVVVERSMVGGSCPNVACLPSKNVIHSAKAVAHCL